MGCVVPVAGAVVGAIVGLLYLADVSKELGIVGGAFAGAIVAVIGYGLLLLLRRER